MLTAYLGYRLWPVQSTSGDSIYHSIIGSVSGLRIQKVDLRDRARRSARWRSMLRPYIEPQVFEESRITHGIIRQTILELTLPA